MRSAETGNKGFCIGPSKGEMDEGEWGNRQILSKGLHSVQTMVFSTTLLRRVLRNIWAPDGCSGEWLWYAPRTFAAWGRRRVDEHPPGVLLELRLLGNICDTQSSRQARSFLTTLEG